MKVAFGSIIKVENGLLEVSSEVEEGIWIYSQGLKMGSGSTPWIWDSLLKYSKEGN